MKKIKIAGKHILMFTIILILAACSKDDEVTFDVHGDVVFLKKMVNNVPVIGTSYYAYSGKTMSSCTVTTPNSAEILNLSAYGINTFLFAFEPVDSAYSSSSPVVGNYIFHATSSDNETMEVSDEQSFSDLGFAQLNERTFDTNNSWLHLTWGEVANADNYSVSLINSAGEIIFNGYAVNADSPEFYISTFLDVGIWTRQPNNGDTYTIRIKCVKYDSDATEDDYTYSVQEISQKDYSVVWKLN